MTDLFVIGNLNAVKPANIAIFGLEARRVQSMCLMGIAVDVGIDLSSLFDRIGDEIAVGQVVVVVVIKERKSQ